MKEKETTWQWLMGWQRIGMFLFMLIFTFLWILGLIEVYSHGALVASILIIGGAWVSYIIGTRKHWKDLRKKEI